MSKSPDLISAAVNSFCMPASSGSNKNYIAAMQKFGEYGMTDRSDEVMAVWFILI
jgi:hypothetical protein